MGIVVPGIRHSKTIEGMKDSILVKQRDMADCGAACLSSVAAFFGLSISVMRIRLYAGTDRQGTSLRGLINAAEHLNFRARAARVTNRLITGIPTPTIFHLALDSGVHHFVVVYGIKKGAVCFMDPAFGKLMRLPLDKFRMIWSGVILLLAPAENFRKGEGEAPVLVRFWRLIRPQRHLFVLAFLGAGIYTLLGLSISLYVQKVFDYGLPKGDKPFVDLISLTVISLLFFRMILGYLKSMLALNTGQRIDRGLIQGYYKHLLELPQQFFDCMRVGEIISRVSDAVRIRIFINDTSISVVVNLFMLVWCLTLMLLYYWKLALVMISGIPLYWLIYRTRNRTNAKWQRKMMETSAALESQLLESIRSVATVRRFGCGHYFGLLLDTKMVSWLKAVYAGSRSSFQLTQLTEWINGLITVCIIWAGSRLVIDRILSPGELLSFYALTAFCTWPVLSLMGANRYMQDALIAADRLFEITDLEAEKKVEADVCLIPAGDLIFNHVHFSYGPGKPVFYDLQLRFPQNRITGVIGESGCGKSTLLALAQRLYPPVAGNILVGNMDIREIPTLLLRREITAVPQHIDLFQGDFIENIALGDPKPDLPRILEICQKLGLDEIISRLPGRYHALIREQGINLSGGQRQKIGIARALYPDPSILFLDEASSALDQESENKVMETLRWFHGFKKTIIIISHGAAFLNFCDTRIHLQNGKAVVLNGQDARSLKPGIFPTGG